MSAHPRTNAVWWTQEGVACVDVSTPKHPGTTTLVDEADLAIMLDGAGRWHAEESSDKKKLYVARQGVARKKQRLHRAILGVKTSSTLGDHENGNTLDNRRVNLRRATFTQNARNRVSHAGSTSKHLGVNWSQATKSWMARIQMGDGTRKYLGVFDNEAEAAAAYGRAAAERDSMFIGRPNG